jgi:hypothetical protein
MRLLRLPILGLFLISASAWAHASEFFIRVEAPSPGSKYHAIKDAVLVIRAYSAGEPTTARLTATAEGLVDGKRRTIALKVRPASEGIYSVAQEWPSQGDWIVVVSAAQRGITCSKLVELGPDGKIPANQTTCLCAKDYLWREGLGVKFNGESKLPVKTAFRRFTEREIEEALRSLTGESEKGGQPVPEGR